MRRYLPLIIILGFVALYALAWRLLPVRLTGREILPDVRLTAGDSYDEP